MRYAGGLLGGTWPASFSADLGNGLFDGAHLVQNFENLNPAQLQLEQVLPRVRQRRHGAGALRGIRALVVELLPDEPRARSNGSRATCSSATSSGRATSGRRTRRPSTCATSSRRSSCSRRSATTSPRRSRRSTGWPTSIARPRRSRPEATSSSVWCTRTSATSASSSPARSHQKEHKEIVSALKAIESMSPGLYEIEDARSARVPAASRPTRSTSAELPPGRSRRRSPGTATSASTKKPFEAAAVSLGIQPARLRALRAAPGAGARRRIHRRCRSAASTRCACSAGHCPISIRGSRGCAGAAQLVKENRQALPADHPLRRAEAGLVELASAALDYHRALRDALRRGAVLPCLRQPVLALHRRPAVRSRRRRQRTRASCPFVKEALASIDKGGYPKRSPASSSSSAPRGDVPLSRAGGAGEPSDKGLHGVPAAASRARRMAPHRRRAGDHRAATSRTRRSRPAALLPQRKDRETHYVDLDRPANDLRADQGLAQRRDARRVRSALAGSARVKEPASADSGNAHEPAALQLLSSILAAQGLDFQHHERAPASPTAGAPFDDLEQSSP